jgi:hypothetical protein
MKQIADCQRRIHELQSQYPNLTEENETFSPQSNSSVSSSSSSENKPVISEDIHAYRMSLEQQRPQFLNPHICASCGTRLIHSFENSQVVCPNKKCGSDREI